MPDLYRLLRGIGFRIDPERAHSIALKAHRLGGHLHRRATSRPITVMGIEFPNRVGLAAGYDKDAEAWRGLAGIGFGHIEIGTVTLRPQPGNPRPRIFRLPHHRALINRMGFPSAGAEVVAERIGGDRPRGVVLGVSIGPNGFSDPDQAAEDYEHLVDRFVPLADYLAINVSSPNTPGLRTLQSGDDMAKLLGRIVDRRTRTVHSDTSPTAGTPIVVKLSPDIPRDELPATVAAIENAGCDGIIVANTTIGRPGVASSETGGLSGAPLRAAALDMLQRVRSLTALPLIASGGIMTVDDARQRLDAGAALVQVYTGFVYAGPQLVTAIVRSSVAPGERGQ